ncbi:MAG: threonine synthase [Pseudomonadota bacterium]
MSKALYVSTRGDRQTLDAAQAIAKGLASDGGLYAPVAFPELSLEVFEGRESLADIAAVLVEPFVAGSVLAEDIARICQDAFSFATPLVRLSHSSSLSVLELFHGPTAAFKDVGARFLAACMERIEAQAEQPLNILVATSGDTGGAVAAAFHGRRNVNVDVFYPAGGVSARQEQQLTCWGDNIRAFRVDGRFDDCQALVKAVFQDALLMRAHRFSSANSINLGRLLPQMCYYAYASLNVWREEGRRPNFIVPTGNLGNALACVWARRAGLPIGDIVLATNANRTIPDYLGSGDWQPRQSVATLASAMDVGNPSNMERLRHLFGEVQVVRDNVSAIAVSDEQIRQQIVHDAQRFDQVWCPHTATAFYAYDQLDADRYRDHWIGVATAHPAKFETIVEPLIHRRVDVPKSLADILELPASSTAISAQLDELRSQYHSINAAPMREK